MLSANISFFDFKDIILDYAAVIAPRTSIIGMYTLMSVSKYIKY